MRRSLRDLRGLQVSLKCNICCSLGKWSHIIRREKSWGVQTKWKKVGGRGLKYWQQKLISFQRAEMVFRWITSCRLKSSLPSGAVSLPATVTHEWIKKKSKKAEQKLRRYNNHPTQSLRGGSDRPAHHSRGESGSPPRAVKPESRTR